eukprot:Skav203250  [mRNA]  locus=scaffold1235:3834:5702:- [translate_table: standard]
MDGDGRLTWTSVSTYWVASWSVAINSKKRLKNEVEGYEDVFTSDLPPEILQVKDTYEWTNFGWIACSGEKIFIAGSNKATRHRAAKAVKDGLGTGNQTPKGSSYNPSEGRAESQGDRPKDGGVTVLFDEGVLHVQANRYDGDRGGADPLAMLQQIEQVLNSLDRQKKRGFLATVQLKGLWWSEGTYESKHESSNRCFAVLSGLFKLGCRGLTGDLDLSQNDLDDRFLRQFLEIVEHCSCSIDLLNLDENRITTAGAIDLLREIASRQTRARKAGHGPMLRRLRLMNNPVDDCALVEAAAHAAGVQSQVGPRWTSEEAEKALCGKALWWTYFYGPVQLLRAKMLELPRQMHMVECPICDCVLKHDLSGRSPQYTVTGNLASHFCGDPHRKMINSLLSSDQKRLPNILIVSPVWTFTMNPVTGQISWDKKDERVPYTRANQNNHWVGARPEAMAVRAMTWQEGREHLARDPRLAYEVLEKRWSADRNDLNMRTEDRNLCVTDIEFTQSSIARRFRDGRPLQDLIYDLDQGNVDPCTHLKLEVVRYNNKYYSNDNRRLFCLKEHQKGVHWNVKVRAEVFELPKVFVRFIDRVLERWNKVGDDQPDYIRVRGQHSSRVPPWRSSSW